ncbi:NADH:flavin oxidoreductase/NADH oxidase family protein [Sporothrix schenckii 1099-18]|uniref:NADH:flavin oxidoreductase/NADH oxidase family protein n=1 Tax=Sporothrix schenckii 1099-18 TaxID=1397361 RepID=A0A0F2MLH4_SPOSC|nr:NADH:flavin oxidoreductase/NADH oxidase family protein [Sporothrix schenckii 1099-18]KJR89031.1 NADH:flavin oxidoreductase/NADH oxidase family protein [Sporothrix schenckii 1099-18]
MASSFANSRLFKPLKLGHAALQHRIALAPLTRNRNDSEHSPTPLMVTYYADRASTSGTLVVSEATAVSHDEEGQRNIPGFTSDRQVAAWKEIIDAVHAKGSVYFQQLFALGRASTADYVAESGRPYRSSSAVAMQGVDATPTAMTEDEIHETIQAFVDSSKRAIAAGADGVEIHAAHGYLLDQFLTDSVNRRTDRWGGSIENRSRLTLEVVKAVVEAVGAERVAVRFSPYAGFQGVEKSDTRELYGYIVGELKKMDNARLAYLSLVAATGDPAAIIFGGKEINKGKTLDFILDAWDNQSPVMIAGGYTPETARLTVDEHYQHYDVLVGFGRHYLANPDLVFRIKNGIPLNKYNRKTFYLVMSNVGYNDYPFSDEFKTTQETLVAA